MYRPVTLFSGQWADLSLEEMCKLTAEMGYDGIELACWGDHFEVSRADTAYLKKKHELLEKHNLQCFAISTHLVGQAVSDRIDARHKAVLPEHVWGDGDPDGVNQRAAEELKQTARVASDFGLKVVNGFTGSPIWHLLYSFPPTPRSMIDDGYKKFAEQWIPILDVFEEAGVKYALEVHPTEIAFDMVTAERTLEALEHHPAFGFNYDPSHFGYQGVDYLEFIYRFAERIYHVHIKEARWSPYPKEAGVFGGYCDFGDRRRYWDFCSPGRGNIAFEEIIRALNRIGYEGPLSVEWEDPGMDRIHGATEAREFVRSIDFPPSRTAFDAAFSQ